MAKRGDRSGIKLTKTGRLPKDEEEKFFRTVIAGRDASRRRKHKDHDKVRKVTAISNTSD